MKKLNIRKVQFKVLTMLFVLCINSMPDKVKSTWEFGDPGINGLRCLGIWGCICRHLGASTDPAGKLWIGIGQRCKQHRKKVKPHVCSWEYKTLIKTFQFSVLLTKVTRSLWESILKYAWKFCCRYVQFPLFTWIQWRTSETPQNMFGRKPV